MKKIIFILLIIIAIVAGIFIYSKKVFKTKSSATPTPTSMKDNGCTTDQLKTDITSEGAAGNIFVTIKITNISKTPCDMTIGNSINILYNAENVTFKYKEPDNIQVISLEPNSTLYSQLHAPNGPQCQGPINEQKINVAYQSNVIGEFNVQACQDKTVTSIDIWPLSKTPITQ